MRKVRLLIIMPSLVLFQLFAIGQNCENMDIGRYPITINGVEVSPGVYQNKSFSWNPLWNFTNIIQTRVSGLDIGNTDLFHGLMQYLPASYNLPANATKKYPVIIYFHGGASMGNGSTSHLCRLFKDTQSDLNTHLAIPGRVERNTSLFSQTVGTETHEFIVISPQFSNYDRLKQDVPEKFPKAEEVEDVIDYVETNYRIDPARIYLTGFSNGANMITEYAASSLARASRIAALMPIALCSQLNHVDNTSRGIDATYIGQAKLKTWFVYCQGDNCGFGPALNVSQDWVNKIKTIPGHEPPRYTILKNQNPASLYNCSDTLLHDAWSRAYNPAFRSSFVNGTGADDGVGQNIYEWFASSVNAVLPIKLKSFTARLADNKVELKWITTDEKNNKSFTIERSGEDQQFKSIANIPGAVNSDIEQSYAYTDGTPLSGLSFYRLVQTDIDGKKTYFDIKKILNRTDKTSSVVVSPNPFASEISAFVSVDKPQKVTLFLSDMSGKILKSANGIYGIGSTEVKLKAEDLPRGMYLLKVSGENFSATQKLVRK